MYIKTKILGVLGFASFFVLGVVGLKVVNAEVSGPYVIIPTTAAIASITITSPTSGSSLNNSGNAITNINWTSSNTTNSPIEIDLLNTSGAIVKYIATGIPNTGSYTWPYDPTLTSGTYKVAVSTQVKAGTPGDAYATSGYFTLVTGTFVPAIPTPASIYQAQIPTPTPTSTFLIPSPGTEADGSNSSRQALQQELVQLLSLFLQLIQQAATKGLLSSSQLNSLLNTISY